MSRQCQIANATYFDSHAIEIIRSGHLTLYMIQYNIPLLHNNLVIVIIIVQLSRSNSVFVQNKNDKLKVNSTQCSLATQQLYEKVQITKREMKCDSGQSYGWSLIVYGNDREIRNSNRVICLALDVVELVNRELINWQRIHIASVHQNSSSPTFLSTI